jgi:hypothetical protein
MARFRTSGLDAVCNFGIRSSTGRYLAVDNHALFEEATRLYRAHDAAALSALYSTEAVMTMPFGEAKGSQEIKEMWDAWFKAFPDIDSEFGTIEFQETGFTVPWDETGTHLGPLEFRGASFPPSGRKLVWSGRSRYSTEDGLIVRVEYEIDTQPLLELLTPEAVT